VPTNATIGGRQRWMADGWHRHIATDLTAVQGERKTALLKMINF
jgi:hypothetical protein